jgi:site-specific recombinase XerC
MPPDVPNATQGQASPATSAARAGAAAVRHAPAPETARLYAADWKAFEAWCTRAGLPTLPAAPATVAAFLAQAGAGGKYGAGALGRRAAAIADRHRQVGCFPPTADPSVRAILSAARRAATPRRKPPSRPAQLLRMAAACPGDLAGIRDRALLLLAAAGGFPRAALVGLDVEHLHVNVTSVELAAAPEAGRPHRVIVPCGATLASCPVQALTDWLRASDTRFGPVFRKIDRWGNVEQSRLGTDAIRRILARRTPRRIRRSRKAVA